MSETAQPATRLPDQTTLAPLVAAILDEAKRQGASTAEAAVSADTGLSVTVRLGEVETLEHHRNRSLGVTVYFGQRKGSASTGDWQPRAIQETVAAACAIARHTAEDTCAGLADPARLASEIPALDLYHPWELSSEAAIELALACEDSARALDTRLDNSDGATVFSSAGMAYYGNSHGFAGGYPSTQHMLSCTMIGRSNGRMERDYWYSVARHAGDLEDAVAVGRRAAERTLRRLDPRRVKTCQVPVLFVPEVARGLIGHFLGAIRGGALYRKSSFLVDKLGEQIFPAFLDIREEPHLPRALGSAPFDAEGVATRPRHIVEQGILQGYVLDSYSARRLGMETTGNAGGVHNAVVKPTGPGFETLVKDLSRGLVVTELMGQGINILTGDYSRGAAGFWVENGEIQYPVAEITVAGNLKEMFRAIQVAGDDVDTRGGIRCGSLLIEGMTVAGE